MPNAELAYQTLDLIEKHPSALHMHSWASPGSIEEDSVTLGVLTATTCGTTACFAGWVATLDGWTIEGSGGHVRKDGQWRHLSDVARELLNLDMHQAARLFHDTGNWELPERVVEIFGPRPTSSIESEG